MLKTVHTLLYKIFAELIFADVDLEMFFAGIYFRGFEQNREN